MNYFNQIFEYVIIPLLGIAVGYFVKWVNAKSKELQAQTDNEIHKKYIDMLEKTIADCVIATNQTYVDTLKENGNFDKEAQYEAFQRTIQAVLQLLTAEAQDYLSTVYNDLHNLIAYKIEAEVNKQKKG